MSTAYPLHVTGEAVTAKTVILPPPPRHRSSAGNHYTTVPKTFADDHEEDQESTDLDELTSDTTDVGILFSLRRVLRRTWLRLRAKSGTFI